MKRQRRPGIAEKVATVLAWLLVGLVVLAFGCHATVALITNRWRVRHDAEVLECYRLVDAVERKARVVAPRGTAEWATDELIREFADRRDPADPTKPAVVHLDQARDAPTCQVALAIVPPTSGHASALLGLQVRNDRAPRSDLSVFRSFRVEW